MNVAQYVADWLAANTSGRGYGVCGGGRMWLDDAVCHHPGLKFIACHHEQAATFAAEADARVSNELVTVHVTAGPGVTNTLTGLACAWTDSIPLLVIAGQVDSRTMMHHGGSLRQLGISEVDGVELVKPITKYAAVVSRPEDIRYHLEMAAHLAKKARPGPVYLEIPLDVQVATIDPNNLVGAVIANSSLVTNVAADCYDDLARSERPVFLVGNGVHLAGAESSFQGLLDFGIPILTSWNASDLISSDHECCIGRPGIIGDRAGNFAIQNADLIIAIGTRLSIPQIGHASQLFAPNAKIVMVDISSDEIKKPTLHVSRPIVMDAKVFLDQFLEQSERFVRTEQQEQWLRRCQQWKKKYPVILPEYRNVRVGINSYYFIERLAHHIHEDAIIVTDVGTAFVGTMQSMPMTGKQRLFHTSGIAPMGSGLPGAIGASFAAPGRQVICLCGDGGIMFNLQELQTIAHYRLPIKIFVLCNNGYMTMQHTQTNHFKREAASSPRSGVSVPNFCDVARAFNIITDHCSQQHSLDGLLKDMLNRSQATLCEIHLPNRQQLMPRMQSVMKDGKFVPTDISDLWPHLPRDEYELNMKPAEKGLSDVVKRLDGQREKTLGSDSEPYSVAH